MSRGYPRIAGRFALIALACALAACSHEPPLGEREAAGAQAGEGQRRAGSGPRAMAGGSVPGTPVEGIKQRGVASWYGRAFEGRETASGEIYDADKLTAAHNTLPLGTRVRVTAEDTGKSVTVRVNDRGPAVPGRTIDLSRRAGELLGITDDGVADVTIEVVSSPPSTAAARSAPKGSVR
jgi:rare lipoprotein A